MTEPSRQYVIRGDDAVVEMWTGKRVQHGSDVRSDWQRDLKVALREALSQLDASRSAVLAGYYSSTTPITARMGDAENILYTNLAEAIPRAFTTLRFERGHSSPQPPPAPIEMPSGHLHYYRYSVGGTWESWEPERTLARWARIPRRVADGADTARPVWFALREANARGLVSVAGDCALDEETRFGVRVTVHAAKNLSHIAISNSEYGIDGAIAAFHGDQLSDELVAAMLPKLRSVSEAELRRALGSVAGPVFPAAAVEISAQGAVRINPADERCWVGEYSVRRDDATGRCLEISGELFTIRPTTTQGA